MTTPQHPSYMSQAFYPGVCGRCSADNTVVSMHWGTTWGDSDTWCMACFARGEGEQGQMAEEQQASVAANDTLGRRIEAGMVVTYPGRYSSSLWMNVGVVRAVVAGEPDRRGKVSASLSVERLEAEKEYGRYEDETNVYVRYETPRRALRRKTVKVVAVDRVTITGMTEDEAVASLMRDGS